MSWSGSEESLGTIRQRYFHLNCDGRQIPGIYWAPETADADCLVLLGHGGTAHKQADYIELVAHGLGQMGIASMAIDGPGHGDRIDGGHPEQGYSLDLEAFSKVWNDGGGTQAIVADWTAALDFIEDECGQRTTGWWGVSMGTMMGLPVTVSDKRIKAAVLGLMGDWGPNGPDLVELAPNVDCPIRFLVQWDDEVVPRDRCLNLFDALGTTKKSMHANTGAHSAVPHFEVQASLDFLAFHLNRATKP